jgi:hypothetical protein
MLPLTVAVILLLGLTSCAGPLGEKIRYLLDRPTYATVVAEVIIGDFSEVTEIVADSLMGRYPDSSLTVLEYHVDESFYSNRASHDRGSYYAGYFGLSLFIDGQPVASAAVNPRQYYATEVAYRRDIRRVTGLYQREIDRELKLIPPVTIDLSVEHDGPLLDLTVGIEPAIDLSGDPLRLRIALVEERVGFTPPSGEEEEHRMVVRHMIGGAAGFELVFDSGRFTLSKNVDLRQIEEQSFQFLARMVELDPNSPLNDTYTRSMRAELRRFSQINPDLLRVVAFVQRESDRAILQAAIIDLTP